MYYFYQPRYIYPGYNYTAHQLAHPTNYHYMRNQQVPHRYQAMQQPSKVQQTAPNGDYQYPPVDTTHFHDSANETRKLMKDANKVIDQLASSKEFDRIVMYHAQRSEMEQVKRLIESTGIESDVELDYNPDGLEIKFKSKVQNVDCCVLTISLRWS